MTREEKVFELWRRVPLSELLTVVAEEAAEVIHAALKFRRACGAAGNPTTVSEYEAERALEEELTDLCVAVSVLDGIDYMIYNPDERLRSLANAKLDRWLDRLDHADPGA